MKSQAKSKNNLKFNKNSLVELNSKQLKTIAGGSTVSDAGIIITWSILENLTSTTLCTSKDK